MNNYQITIFVLLCVLIDCFAPVQKMHCDNMCHLKTFNVDNYRSLNEQLSLDGLNDHCEYIEPNLIKELHTQNTDLGVMQLNVRGLLNKQSEIKNLLSDNNVLLPIDVVLLCETWLKPSTLDLLDIPNYKMFHITRKDQIGGGTSILVNEKIRSRERRDLLVETQFLEHCIVELKTDKSNILLVSAYRPSNTNVKIFLTEYKKLLDRLKKQKNYEIVIGLDHNLDLLKSHLNEPTNEFIELNLDRELIPCITKPTRITSKSATLIDNILISRSLQRHFTSSVVIEDISDHFACLVVLKDQNKSIKGPKYIKTRNLDDLKIANIVSSLQEYNWKEILGPLNADDGFNMVHSKLITTIDKIAPKTEIRLSKSKTPRDPWITKGLLRSVQKQKELYSEQLSDPTITNQYKAYRNLLQKILRKAKITYFRDKCNEYKQDSRKLWKLIHAILNKTCHKGDRIKAIKKDGIPRYDPETITNEFCEHFSNIGETFAKKYLLPPSVYQNTYILFLKMIKAYSSSLLVSKRSWH